MEEWTQAQTRAWEYIQSAIDHVQNATAALREYRAGGGAIRSSDWYTAYNRLESSGKEWSTLNYLNKQDTLPESMFGATPVNYSGKYTVSFKASVKDAFTGERVSLYRQISFDNRLTKQEMFDAMNDTLTQDKSTPASAVNNITEIKFFKKGG